MALNLVVEETGKPKSAEYGASLRKYYRLNQDALIFSEMKSLLSKFQILGEEALVNDVKEKGGKIKLFLLTGHFTHNSQ